VIGHLEAHVGACQCRSCVGCSGCLPPGQCGVPTKAVRNWCRRQTGFMWAYLPSKLNCCFRMVSFGLG
jgi:hypothetical protein